MEGKNRREGHSAMKTGIWEVTARDGKLCSGSSRFCFYRKRLLISASKENLSVSQCVVLERENV